MFCILQLVLYSSCFECFMEGSDEWFSCEGAMLSCQMDVYETFCSSKKSKYNNQCLPSLYFGWIDYFFFRMGWFFLSMMVMLKCKM